MRHISWFVLWSVSFLVSSAYGAVVHVPGGAPTIAGAVGIAAPGDTVLIDCGTYSEFGITLSSDITILGATGDADCVVIDAASQGRVFTNDNPTAAIVIQGVTVQGGVAPGTGTYGTWGGGMLLLGPAPVILNCAFVGNTAEAGGGLAVGGHGPGVIGGCTFTGNEADYGAGALTFVGTPTFDGCLFYGNVADSTGGAIEAYLSLPIVRASTFYGNGAGLEGGVLYAGESSAFDVETSILSYSTAGEAVACDVTSSAALVCSDVYGNAGGDWVGCIAGQQGANGNIALDPQFCDPGTGHFGLHVLSPCRPANHPDGPACGLIGFSGELCSTLGIPRENPVLTPVTLRAWPNPFHGSLQFSHSGEGVARVSIFDVTGRVLRTFDGVSPQDVILWDGTTGGGRSVPAGTYYMRLELDGATVTSPVLRLR